MFIKCTLAVIVLFQACWAFEPRITDGTDAEPGEFPHQVSVQWSISTLIPFQHMCGGSILNERYVLTAGHCVMKYGKMRVVAGKYYLTKIEPQYEQAVLVAQSIVHNGYTGDIAQHDIALLRLQTPLTFNRRVAPVKLPAQDENQTGLCALSGWGSISKNLIPVTPAVLQKAIIPIIGNDFCLKVLLEKDNLLGKQPKIYPTQVCTGPVDQEIAACSGDSGGPLVQYVHGASVQVGVVSWGTYPCGVGHSPSVYTRVASYVNWIQERMV